MIVNQFEDGDDIQYVVVVCGGPELHNTDRIKKFGFPSSKLKVIAKSSKTALSLHSYVPNPYHIRV